MAVDDQTCLVVLMTTRICPVITSVFDHKLSIFSRFKRLLEILKINIVLGDNQKVYVDNQVFVFGRPQTTGNLDEFS